MTSDPSDLARQPIPALVQIRSLLADGQPIPFQRPRIPASQRRINLQFSGISLPVPDRVRYRYRLDGFDEDWSEATATRQADYTNLNAGTYRFHVIASNSDGVWNSSDTSLPFVIEPALWQTWWFRLCSVSMLLLAVWSTYLLRTRQLANQLRSRFEARLAERMRIAQNLHDTLLQGFLSTSLQLDVANEYIAQDSPAAPIISRVLVLMRQVVEDCRSSLMTLRSADQVSGTLESALSALPQDFRLERGATYRTIVNGVPYPLNASCSGELFLLAREAVLNSYHHADATLIEVELAYKRTGLHLFIRDDGRGIDPAIMEFGKERHWGLTGMRERAKTLGAQFSLWSLPAKGTEIQVFVPSNVAYLRIKPRSLLDRFQRRVKTREI